MKKNAIVLSIALGLTFSSRVLAGDVRAYVSDQKDKSCVPKDVPEYVGTVLLSSDEMIAGLQSYFAGDMQNASLKNNLSAAIVNAQLKFCSQKERQKVFSFLLERLNVPKPEKDVISVFANYMRTKSMKQMIQEKLKDPKLDPNFKTNLEKARSRK